MRRKDGLDAYQLAVVVDDAAQGITHVVRGSDLLDSTPRQIFLQQQLAYPTPRYAHLPVITTGQGQKFSKQNHAPALDNEQAADNLRLCAAFSAPGGSAAYTHRCRTTAVLCHRALGAAAGSGDDGHPGCQHWPGRMNFTHGSRFSSIDCRNHFRRYSDCT